MLNTAAEVMYDAAVVEARFLYKIKTIIMCFSYMDDGGQLLLFCYNQLLAKE